MKTNEGVAIVFLMLTVGLGTVCIQIIWASESVGISGREQPVHKIVQSDPIFPKPPPTEPRPNLPWPTPPRPNEPMRPGDPAPNFPQTDSIPVGQQKNTRSDPPHR